MHTHGVNPNYCQPNDGKVNQKKGVNRRCVRDGLMDKVSACVCEERVGVNVHLLQTHKVTFQHTPQGVMSCTVTLLL